MASLSTNTGLYPARIRNLSPHGALVEADELPALGQRCRLRRGNESIAGTIVRLDGNQAGLRFDRPTAVAAWYPSGNLKQQEVDRVFQASKHQYPVADRHHAYTKSSAQTNPVDEELIDLAERIEALGDDLSEDPEIIMRYLEKLQVLDMAAQKFRKLARRQARLAG